MSEGATIERAPSERHGSRFLYAPPTPEDFANWFNTVPLHDEMEHDRYLQGITLIPQSEEVKETRINAEQAYYIAELGKRSVFIPYAKVETRVQYFWDFVHKHEDWVGVIEPVDVRGPQHLPPGFNEVVVRTGENSGTRFITCTMRAAIYERQSYGKVLNGEKAPPIYIGTGTKQVSYTRSNSSRTWADENALMKVETGAVGRALGLAGMLVIPGSGIATAEDVQESMSQDRAASTPEQATLPDQEAESGAQERSELPDDEGVLRERAAALATQLKNEYPDAFESYKELHAERGWGELSAMPAPALRGIVRALEKRLDEAQNATPDES